MSRLYYKYGAMGGGKSLECISVYYNYTNRGMVAKCYKPELDTRSTKIESRAQTSIDCDVIPRGAKIKDVVDFNCDVVLIDEAQFLNEEQVRDLKHIIMDIEEEEGRKVPVICYGLRTNFKSELFEGAKALFELADSITKIKSVCWCGSEAVQNARVVGGKVVRTGEEVLIGGDESYVALCYKHYREGNLGEKK